MFDTKTADHIVYQNHAAPIINENVLLIIIMFICK